MLPQCEQVKIKIILFFMYGLFVFIFSLNFKYYVDIHIIFKLSKIYMTLCFNMWKITCYVTTNLIFSSIPVHKDTTFNPF